MVPDLIISDVMMPKKDGFEVTTAIRSHLATSHIPLILLTAKAALESRLAGLRRGADAYLTKPFSPAELALRIEKLIEMRRMLQRRYTQPDFEPDPEQAEDDFILQLRAFLEEHMDNPKLNAEDVGRHFGLSRSQLYRKIQSLTDTTLMEHIRLIRLEKALELIRQKELSLSQISLEVGFSSISYFSKAFKKHFGKTPSEMAKG